MCSSSSVQKEVGRLYVVAVFCLASLDLFSRARPPTHRNTNDDTSSLSLSLSHTSTHPHTAVLFHSTNVKGCTPPHGYIERQTNGKSVSPVIKLIEDVGASCLSRLALRKLAHSWSPLSTPVSPGGRSKSLFPSPSSHLPHMVVV